MHKLESNFQMREERFVNSEMPWALVGHSLLSPLSEAHVLTHDTSVVGTILLYHMRTATLPPSCLLTRPYFIKHNTDEQDIATTSRPRAMGINT